MKNNFNSRDPKISFQISTLLFSLAVIFGINIFRSNKNVLIHSFYEDLMPYLHRISHIGRLLEKETNEDKIIKQNYSNLFKYLLSFSIFKGETKEAKLLPVLRINLPYEDMNLIRQDRYQSIRRGYLTNPKWADGTISHKGEVYRAKFRLKGDLGQHWLGNKRFSLRIRTKKSKTGFGKPSILGMKTFSLHKLAARAYPYENIFQEILKEFDFHSVTHKLVKVFVNGENWGIMDMQEHFGTALLEKNKLRDSLIFTFSNDKRFAYSRDTEEQISYQNYWLNHPRLFLKLTGANYTDLDIFQKKQFDYIASTIREPDYQYKLFSQRHLKEASDLLNIWGDFHPIALNNIKFYLNPFTLKLEPLMSDQRTFKSNKNGFRDGIREITGGFLNIKDYKNSGNHKYKKAVINELGKIESKFKISEKIFPQNPPLNIEKARKNFTESGIINTENDIYSYYPKYLDSIKCNGRKSYIPLNYPAIEAKYSENKIEIIPLLCGEFKITKAKICNFDFPLNTYIKPKNISIYRPKIIKLNNTNSRRLSKKQLNCSKDTNFLFYSFNGDSKNTLLKPITNKRSAFNPLFKSTKPKFIKAIDEKKYIIKGGVWDVKKPIFIEGEIEIKKGTVLRFSQNSYMIVKGNIKINGSDQQPVKLTSINKNSSWKGLYVFNEKKEKQFSHLKKLKVSNTESTKIGVLNLTGGITFYNTNILIDDLEIENSIAEDALNIVKGDVNIKNIYISKSKSDGFDCDFCKGNIDNLNLETIGGDGLDISGSEINASIKKANNVKDKVVSIGEESIANISIKNVSNSYLAAAIKDGSKGNIKLENVATKGPLAMSYIKKDFFQKDTIANIFYDENFLKDISDKFLADKKTIMRLNNKIKSGININVRDLYKTGPMKKIR
ncbi:CotH kinase family protein [Prochlorococcus sp. AH-736-F09]|nr:CotH kinase family protein [Prochlorococcus sp. AH-736-F09]